MNKTNNSSTDPSTGISSGSSTGISSDQIVNHIKNTSLISNIIVRESVTSTNSLLKDMAKAGAPDGTVLIAEAQTSGRGRLGRSFHSPKDTGIYFSILLRPSMSANESLFLTTSAAVAVAKGIEDISNHKADIKWVNDVYISDRKVCGILTEGSINSTGNLDYAIVGIGINIYPPADNFPDDIKNIAGSVFNHYTSNTENEKEKLIASILDYFTEYYLNFSDKAFFDEYKQRSFLLGRKIYIIENDIRIPATALDIDEECHLIVELEDGQIRELSSGEVSIKLS